MPQTDEIEVVTLALVDIFETDITLGIEDVYYGEEQLIPRTPAVSVAVSKSRVPYQTGSTYLVTFNAVIDVFHSKYKSKQITRQECDQFAQSVEKLLHADLKLGGLVTNSFVSAIQTGGLRAGTTLMQASRLTWQATSRKRIV